MPQPWASRPAFRRPTPVLLSPRRRTSGRFSGSRGSCGCGGRFTFRAKPRCPKCRSTRQADPAKLGDPKSAPEAFVREWVSHAREIHQARAVAAADREEADREFDELISRFRLDPAALS